MKPSHAFSRSLSARERRAPTGNRKRRPPAKAVTDCLKEVLPHQLPKRRPDGYLHPCPFCGSGEVSLHEPFFGKAPNVPIDPSPGLMIVGSNYNPLTDNYCVICAKCNAIGPLARTAQMAKLLWDLRISHR